MGTDAERTIVMAIRRRDCGEEGQKGSLLLLASLFLAASIALHLYLHTHQAIHTSARRGSLPQRSHTVQLHDALFQHYQR
jgi:hypothetical protein